MSSIDHEARADKAEIEVKELKRLLLRMFDAARTDDGGGRPLDYDDPCIANYHGDCCVHSLDSIEDCWYPEVLKVTGRWNQYRMYLMENGDPQTDVHHPEYKG